MSYQLEGAWIGVRNRRLLSDMTWSVPSGSIAVVFGPVSTGKSTLLALLSGRRAVDLSIGGQWRYEGEDLSVLWERESPPSSIAWVPQIRHAPATVEADQVDGVLARVDSALCCGAPTVLLDEPARGLPDDARDGLVERLRDFARNGGTGIVVTHNVELGRAIADQVILLHEGRCEAATDATSFFAEPPSEAARMLIEHGCCSPSLPQPPPLPKHFRWLLPERLGGMGEPGLFDDVDDDLFAIASAGVGVLFSVTESPVPLVRLRPYGITGHHVPCNDMGVPTVRDALLACRTAVTAMERGDKVVVHCRAGLGRTGTLLACILVCLGRSPDEAIAEVRALSPRYIQSDVQLRFIAEIGGEVAA